MGRWPSGRPAGPSSSSSSSSVILAGKGGSPVRGARVEGGLYRGRAAGSPVLDLLQPPTGSLALLLRPDLFHFLAGRFRRVGGRPRAARPPCRLLARGAPGEETAKRLAPGAAADTPPACLPACLLAWGPAPLTPPALPPTGASSRRAAGRRPG